MAKNMKLELYRSGTGDSLYLTQQFIYEVEISKISHNKCELINVQNFSLPEFREVKNCKPTTLKNGDVVIKETYLVGAPEEYLVKNNYKKQ